MAGDGFKNSQGYPQSSEGGGGDGLNDFFLRAYQKIQEHARISINTVLLLLSLTIGLPKEAHAEENPQQFFIEKIQSTFPQINLKYLTLFYNSVQNNGTENMFSSIPWKGIISKINPKDIPGLKIKVENYFTENPPNQKRIDEMRASHRAVEESEVALKQSEVALEQSKTIAGLLQAYTPNSKKESRK